MYRNEAFKEDRPEVLQAAMRQIQLAAIVTTSERGIEVTHAPMVVRTETVSNQAGSNEAASTETARTTNDQLYLECHMARKNPHWQSATRSIASVAIFQGPHSYVSPSWYPTKAKNGKVVPTWAYIAIHAHGNLKVMDDRAWLERHLNSLTDANEAQRESPWQVSDAPTDYLARMSGAIVGLSLSVNRLEGSWKLNQHKEEADRKGSAIGLAGSGPMGEQLAEAMRSFEQSIKESDAN